MIGFQQQEELIKIIIFVAFLSHMQYMGKLVAVLVKLTWQFKISIIICFKKCKCKTDTVLYFYINNLETRYMNIVTFGRIQQ